MESKLYNPAQLPKEWLIDRFIVRTKVFDKIFKDILKGTMQYPEQHYLIQGQRGMGKTTLLLRLKYEIENTPQLNEWLVPVFFNEESYDLTSLSNLWEKLLKYLDNLWNTGGKYYEQTDDFIGREDYERKCFDLLETILKEHGKKLIIFFDNFGQLFLDNLAEMETHRFREILMNHNSIRIIGASAVVLQDLHDYSKPFFEFFKVINLEGLDTNETIRLIDELQAKSGPPIDIKKNKARIETLAVLSRGVTRTIMLIYEVLLADQDGTALRDLESILDKITPLYKHRMEDLPVQQRKIVDVIARRWDAVSTKEIAESIRENGKPSASKLISAQLQQLEKNNIITKKNTGGKNHLYQLRERFFNIWYLMRNGDRSDKRRVIWLTKFLEAWYDDSTAIADFISQHIERLKSGNYYADSALMIAEALSNSSHIDIYVHDLLIKATKRVLDENQQQILPESGKKIFEQAIVLYTTGDYDAVIKKLSPVGLHSSELNNLLCNSYINLHQPEVALKKIAEYNIYAHLTKALALRDLNRYDEAIAVLKEGLERCNYEIIKSATAFTLAVFHASLFRDEEKEFHYLKLAAEMNHKEAKFKLAQIYERRTDFIEAERIYLELLKGDEPKIAFQLLKTYIFKTKEIDKANELLNLYLLKYPDNLDFQFIDALLSIYKGKRNLGITMFTTLQKEYEREKQFDLPYQIIAVILSAIHIFSKEKNKATAQLSALKHVTKYPSPLFQAIIFLWNGQFEKSFECTYFLSDNSEKKISEYIQYEETYLLLLLAKNQYHFAKKLFDHPDLEYKDKFKPIYYALMSYMADEYPNELLRMGEELEQPVASVKERVEVMREEYK